MANRNHVMNTRPRIRIEPTPTDIVVEIAAVAAVVFCVYVTARFYPELPQRMPTHSNLVGKVDGWGPKSSLVGMPILTLVLYLALSAVSRFPHIGNYPVEVTAENAERIYWVAVSMSRWLKMEMLWMFAYMTWMTIQVSLGKAKDPGAAPMYAILAVILGTLILMIVRLYRAK